MIHNETLDHSFRLSATSRRIFEALWGRDAVSEHPSLRNSSRFDYLRLHTNRASHCPPENRAPSAEIAERRGTPSPDRRLAARRQPANPRSSS